MATAEQVVVAVNPEVRPVETIQRPQQTRRNFATRRFIKIAAVVCECGRTSHGPGVRKWKRCPHCGAFIISARDQRTRDGHYFFKSDEERLHAKYAGGAS